MNNGAQLRGYGLFMFFYAALRATHTKGLRAGVASLWMGVLRYVVERGTTALVYSWKARQFTHWRLSRKISQEAYRKREAACSACPALLVVDDGRYVLQASRYCGSCGCSQNRWSELTESKNWREGHICPRLQFPEQAEQLKRKEEAEKLAKERAAQMAKNPKGGCKGCGGNGRGRNLEDWHERAGLLTANTRGVP
jgi:hypothetical protein